MEKYLVLVQREKNVPEEEPQAFFSPRAELAAHSTRTPSLSRHVLPSRSVELDCYILQFLREFPDNW